VHGTTQYRRKPKERVKTDGIRRGIRLGALRSDPSSPGHAIALAIKKGVPTEVPVDRQSPTHGSRASLRTLPEKWLTTAAKLFRLPEEQIVRMSAQCVRNALVCFHPCSEEFFRCEANYHLTTQPSVFCTEFDLLLLIPMMRRWQWADAYRDIWNNH